MIALDTNVLVRYLTQDDEAQFLAVLSLLNRKRAKFWVSDLVLVELDWVLTALYEWTRDEIADAFAMLLTVHNLVFESEPRIHRALRAVRQSADLSDELIVAYAHQAGCKELATFDKGLIKRHRGFAKTPL